MAIIIVLRWIRYQYPWLHSIGCTFYDPPLSHTNDKAGTQVRTTHSALLDVLEGFHIPTTSLRKISAKL
jgi:hypothetical protein